MIRPRRRASRHAVAVAAVAAVVVGAALTACTANVVSDAEQWLRGQDGVQVVEVVVDRTTITGSSGVLRGDLVDGIDAARLESLVARASDYVRDHPSTELRLGTAHVDFVVADDVARTTRARELWDGVVPLGGVLSATIAHDDVRLHVLRPDAAPTLDAVRDLPVTVEVEAFRTTDDELTDRADDDYGPPRRTAGSLQVVRTLACAPSDERWQSALAVIADEAIDAGTVDVCDGYDLSYRPETDLVVVATAWAERQEIAADPLPSLIVSEGPNGDHVIEVTPGRADLFAVVAPFEAADAPDVIYHLDASGGLEVLGWDHPAGVVFDLIARSPLAAELTQIAIEGEAVGFHDGGSIRVTGTLAEIGGLVADAEALMPLHDSFYSVAIEPSVVRIDLYSPPGTTPDMAAAAAALRTSPIWRTRPVVVGYEQGYVLIEGGFATIGDAYTDREPYDDFAAAWNAG